VDHNRISDLSSIMGMDSLVKLSARGNRIEKLDVTLSRWSQLECLELAENDLGEVIGLEALSGLVTLNLGELISCLDAIQELTNRRG
jgi:Leucine-rich repeat (LRR) protein